MKFIKGNIPLISAILIFVGYWNLAQFYDLFGISIYQYVSTSEIILSFLPLLKNILLITTIVIVCFLMLTWNKIFGIKKEQPSEYEKIDLHKDDWKILKKIKELFSKKSYSKKILHNIFTFLLLLIDLVANLAFFCYLLFWVGLIIYGAVKMDMTIPTFFNIIILHVIIVIVSIWALFDKFIIPNVREPIKAVLDKYAYPASLLIIIITINYVSNLKNACNVLNKHPKEEAHIITKERSYATKDSLVFIGETQSYVFLRNLKSLTNIVIPKTEISAMELTRKK